MLTANKQKRGSHLAQKFHVLVFGAFAILSLRRLSTLVKLGNVGVGLGCCSFGCINILLVLDACQCLRIGVCSHR